MSIFHNRERELEVLTLLCARFPKAFFMYQERRRPLKIGIREDIEAVLGDSVERELLRPALKIYFVNRGYFRSLLAGASRLDLDGNPAGVVTPEEAERAKRDAAGLRAATAKLKPKPKPAPVRVPTRDGLSALREAARKRREAAAEGGAA